MNKLKSITASLLFFLLVTDVHFSNSGEAEQKQQRVHQKSKASRYRAETTELEFYEELGKIPSKKPTDSSQGLETIMQTPKPEADRNVIYRIGACTKKVAADLDADGVPEKVCVRYLQHKEYDDQYIYTSLIVDVFKTKRQILRQELNRGFFFEEFFAGLKDVTGNGKPELITRVRFSPDCSVCNAHRIYIFNAGRFELSVNLFNTRPDHEGLAGVIQQIAAVHDIILKAYRQKTKSQLPRGYWQDCVGSIPWIVNLDNDDRLEMILLAHPSACGDPHSDKYYRIFLAEFSATGELAGYRLHQTELDGCDGFVDVLGFLQTKDKHTLLLINFAYGGTSSAYPVLNVFDARPTCFAKIGEFAGFYEQVIAERLRDLDQDGNTEIIYVGESYWPPGRAHAGIVLFYDIAEYKNGRYVEANVKYKKIRDRLNDFSEKLRKK